MDFYIVCSFFHNKSKQARVPTFVLLFHGDATSGKGPVCDEGTNLRLRDFAVVPLMPTRENVRNITNNSRTPIWLLGWCLATCES